MSIDYTHLEAWDKVDRAIKRVTTSSVFTLSESIKELETARQAYEAIIFARAMGKSLREDTTA